jgi:CubicO group peptidase (beta-lactamase class C family)
MEQCTRQLQAIGRALAAYECHHGKLPPHLSSLYPEYVTDKAIFHCPADPSMGSPGEDWAPVDPKLPISYLYEMSTDPAPEAWINQQGLGSRQPGPGATWGDFKLLDRRYFGDRVPVVSCWHHGEGRLNLGAGGQVYLSQGNWEDEPDSLAAPLRRMEQDLPAGLAVFAHDWSLQGIERFYADRIDNALPPALRYELGVAAERLFAAAERASAGPHSHDAGSPALAGDAYRLAARFYQAAGQMERAIAACEAALRLPGEHTDTVALLAELRYCASGMRGAPPVDACVEAERRRQRCPSMAVAVVRNGKVILARGYGLANRERSVPATKDTVYAIRSVTKSFTATGIMMLAEEGKLSVDDRISRYLPGTPAAWEGITIRHLLTHTSGLVVDPDPDHGPADEMIRSLAKLPLLFPPGEQWSYSSAGYFLLGQIIERVSGKPLEVFLDERIFRPLQMTSTAKNAGDLNILAQPYAVNGQVKPVNPTAAYGASGYVSTVVDLARWDAALYSDQFLQPSTREQMWTPGRLNNGKPLDYGLGWSVGSYHGHRRVDHSGSGAHGFRANITRFVDDRLTVIVLTNEVPNAFKVVLEIARFYLPAPGTIEDADPSLTRRLKHALVQLAEGQADPALFAPAVQITLLPELKQIAAFYRSLGALESFRLIERDPMAGQPTYRYRTVFGNTAWIHSFMLTGEGKIAEVTVEPE